MTEQIAPPFNTVTPSLVVPNSKQAIEFYQKAFDATKVYEFPTPDGKTMHAMIMIGDSPIMMSDEFPTMGSKSPSTLGGTAVSIHLYVKDADKTFNQAVGAGAKIVMPMMDAFWGDRFGAIQDPFGHSWTIGTPQKNMSSEEIQQAGKDYFENMEKNQT